ncbi:F-box only protein 43 [Anthophora quadrimaculata]
MDEIENINIGETPHGTINLSNRSSHDSVDSGYLTPHSGVYTPVISGCRSRVSCISSKRHHRIRLDPLQSERAQRHRSKLNHLLNVSESDYLVSENSDRESLIQDVSSFTDDPSSLSLEHSSLDLTNEHTGCRKFDGSFRMRTRRNCKTTVPITPASTRLQLLSPPPSPAVPSSSFIASEPFEEDVEMKLVIVPQSTPQVTTSPRRKTPPIPFPRIVISPTCRKASPAISSAENQKLSKLSITDLATVVEIKPKRLDFSHRALSVALNYPRAIPDYTGRETVDILTLLGEKSNHWRIVSKIFSFLGSQDLCSVSMVSKTWRRICTNDCRANTRRLTHVILRQNAKENLKLIKKSKIEGDIQNSPKSRYARKGYLLEVQNLLQVQGNQRPPSSPPVSPSKVKFHSFVKASRTLAPWEHLLPCPKCSFPCHVDGEKNVGTCSRQGCSMEFCTSCSSRPHTGPCKTPLLATPTKRNKRLVVGSRQSKRNLRRL